MCPGHPLLDATLDLILERHRGLLKRGAVRIDDTDEGDQPRALLYLEHGIQNARTDRGGTRRVVSKQLQFVKVDADGQAINAGPAPYLDYRPPTAEETQAIQHLPWPDWMRDDLEARAMEPDDFILALALIDGDSVEVRYVRKPFGREPGFGATSVNYDLNDLLAQAKEPS